VSYTDQVRALEEFLNRTDGAAADTPDVPATHELRAPTFALAYAAAAARDRQRPERKEILMMKSATNSPEPETVATGLHPALRAVTAQIAAQQDYHAHANQRAYRAELDRLFTEDRYRTAVGVGARPPEFLSLLDALAAELAALAAQDKPSRGPAERVRTRYRAPHRDDPRELRDALAALWNNAESILRTLDSIGALETWMNKTHAVGEETSIDSPLGLAADHYAQVLPLLDRARTLPGTVAALPALIEMVDTVTARLQASGVTVEAPHRGALPAPPPPPARSKTVELRHGV